jgi:hypothetical protein
MPRKKPSTKWKNHTNSPPASEFTDDTQTETNNPKDVPPQSDGDTGRANETGKSAKERRKRGKG